MDAFKCSCSYMRTAFLQRCMRRSGRRFRTICFQSSKTTKTMVKRPHIKEEGFL
ncbi:hypothetical protein ROSINTL182_08141 [Roseburia intestinalis L1-82]|uniref:Uncharacterized protein n=1 Tax=Roseburia intestinalis L1-82 TaxID=536231 RepID=C7GDY9_9FIRM|nr:hypothetical protein ROSINTL182_08141 [Roseburia intestinalis L1-82]